MSTRILNAVVTLAGPSERALPLHSFVDRDLVRKSALSILVEEALAAGVERVGLVVHPEDEEAYARAAAPHRSRLEFIHQPEPQGYGDALLRTRAFTDDAPFLHLVGDHLMVAKDRPCSLQLAEVAESEGCTVSAVQSTREGRLAECGAVGAKPIPGKPRCYTVEDVVEKPTPTEAEQRLMVPGLRAGHYLGFFGVHVLHPSVFEALEALPTDAPSGGELARALAWLAPRERVLAFEPEGARYDLAPRWGLLHAQLALGLAGLDRDEVLAGLCERLAEREGPA